MRPQPPFWMTTLALGGIACPASAEIIQFEGTLEVGCTLFVSDGELAPNTEYTTISTEEAGGQPADLAVWPVGGAARVQFAAPQFHSSTQISGVTPEIKWYSESGLLSNYSSAPSESSPSSSPDVFKIDARAIKGEGFPAGDYLIDVVATCSA